MIIVHVHQSGTKLTRHLSSGWVVTTGLGEHRETEGDSEWLGRGLDKDCLLPAYKRTTIGRAETARLGFGRKRPDRFVAEIPSCPLCWFVPDVQRFPCAPHMSPGNDGIE